MKPYIAIMDQKRKDLIGSKFKEKGDYFVIPLLFLQCGAILLSGNAPIIKITLWVHLHPKLHRFFDTALPVFMKQRHFMLAICTWSDAYLTDAL